MRESKLLWRQRRVLTLLLTLCLLLTCMPLPALSVNETAACAGEAENTSDEVYIIDEDVTKRGEFEKHFLCSDGTYRAVTYAEPVHHYDSATGAWQDNDVSLALNAASARYEAQSGSFAVSFAKSYAAPAAAVTSDASGSLTADGGISQNAASAETSALPSVQTVTMTNGTYPISWTTAVKPSLSIAEDTAIQRSALDAPKLLTRTPAASILTSAEAEAAAQQSFAGKPISDANAFAAANRVSVAEYASVAQVPGQGDGVSLRYSVSQHKIKEFIIANRSAVTDFVTTLDVGALTAVAQDDGSVLLTDEYGNTAYTVGVPYLYDADYNVSYEVAVTVEQTRSVCRITYAPNREWLDDTNRAYPVVLDPTVTSSEYYANIVDTYVTQADSNNHSAEGNLVVGIKSGKLNRAYIRINNLPSLPDEVLPLSANLTIKHGANTTTGRTMSLYRTNSSWSPTTITYNNQPSSVTSVASCAFNTANVSFDIPKTHIDDLYNREAAGMNYGYQIRYTSESTTNPDYNMLRSMEYPTTSEQPLFTVNYGYTLPSALTVGTVYSFLNAGSKKYLDVCGGTDADNNNVAQYKGNSTVSQDFKLEQSSTGNGYILRAQVGGKTRVLDIYKTNGRVENGNNVQIYRNVDPIAQEWLIVPISDTYYKIMPRSNPALALTSYGSADGSATGKSTTSAGNVFVSTYTGNNPNQWWRIERENGNFMDPGAAPLSNGSYYLNNKLTSMYLKETNGSVTAATITSTTLNYRWKFTNISGKYVIQPEGRAHTYLASGTVSTNSSVSLISITGDTIPERCLWTVTRDDDELTIVSYLGRRLSNTSGSLITTTSSGSTQDAWRFLEKDDYVFMPNSFGFGWSKLNKGTKLLLTVADMDGVSFTDVSDFSYSVESQYPSNAVELSYSADGLLTYLTANQTGNADIKITHKPSGKMQTVRIYTGVYSIEDFGDADVGEYPDYQLTKKDARFFYFPDSGIDNSVYQARIKSSLETMLSARGMRSLEMIDGFCQIYQNPPLPNTINKFLVTDKVYKVVEDGVVLYRPVIELLRRSKYAVFYTHGSENGNSILLTPQNSSEPIRLTADDINQLPDGYLKDCELIILLSCDAGKASDDGLAIALYACGAQNVIGFTNEADIKDATAFTCTMMNFLAHDDNADLDANGQVTIDIYNPLNVQLLPILCTIDSQFHCTGRKRTIAEAFKHTIHHMALPSIQGGVDTDYSALVHMYPNPY